MTEEEIIELIKANSFVCDYRDGRQSFELEESNLSTIAKIIASKQAK